MTASDEQLIQRLQKRSTKLSGVDEFPAITAKELQIAERAVGFKFPEVLRGIYLNVGNGGFGPEYGIVGTKGGARRDGCTLETCYQKMLELEMENPVWRWPTRLLPLAEYGCGMWGCVDCEYKKLPMILWDPNNLNSEFKGADAKQNWGNSFWDIGQPFRTWLQSWLVEKQQPEPKWPSDSWMKKRLGFTWPN